MGEKLLSVIIPMYNSEKFIRKCLDSLLVSEEWMQYLEVIVVNDGSTDGGPGLVQTYTERYPEGIRLLNKENGGHGSAINEGTRICNGWYLKILDADDWYDTRALERVLQRLRDLAERGEEDAPDAILTPYDLYDIQTNTATPVSVPKEAEGEISIEVLLRDWEVYKNLCCLHGLLYRTAFYRSLGLRLPEKVFYDDAFYFIVPMSQVQHILVLREKLYVYRVGDVSQSVSVESRVRRIGQLEKVLYAILGTEGETRGAAGQEYWYRKTVSSCTDYLVTALLRFRDKRAGRTHAKAFMGYLQERQSALFGRLKRRYQVFLVLNRLGCDERAFQMLLRLRGK